MKPSWLFPPGSCLLSHVQPLSPCTLLVAVCQLFMSVPALGYLWMLRPSWRLRKVPCCGSPSLLSLPLVAGSRPCVQRPGQETAPAMKCQAGYPHVVGLCSHLILTELCGFQEVKQGVM